MKRVCIIPARYGSTRFPGKPLKDICGKMMIEWVYEAAINTQQFDEVIVATDSDEIKSVCTEKSIQVLLTSNNHPTAIHRLGEVAGKIKADYYVQLNGDEPLIKPDTISRVLVENGEIDNIWGSNVIAPIKSTVELMDNSNIKMLFNNDMNCVYMSRNVVPFPFKSLEFEYYKHVGVIGFTPRMIRFYQNSTPGQLETIEGIDLLRFIDYSKPMKLIIDNNCETLSVDTEKDLDEVRRRIEKNKILNY